jgi:hypothetical protein
VDILPVKIREEKRRKPKPLYILSFFNAVQQNLSLEANSRSAGQEIPRLL